MVGLLYILNYKGHGKKLSWPIYELSPLPHICLDELKKVTKVLSRSPGRDLSPRFPEYEAELLNTRPRLSTHAHARTHHNFGKECFKL